MSKATVVGFISTAAGTGATSTLANLACILASGGRRVLIVDWAAAPRVAEYLEPFRGRQPPEDFRHLLIPGTQSSGVADSEPEDAKRFVVPDTSGYVDVIGSSDANASASYRDPGTPSAIIELRNRLVSAAYDDVLIDAPSIDLDGTADMVAKLCDLAIVCFRPRARAIQHAAELAANLRHTAPVHLGVLPVAVAFNENSERIAQRIRSQISYAFAAVVDGQEWPANPGAVEIPHQPYESFDPVVAFLVEEPSPVGPLYRGYGQIAYAITNGALTEPPPPSHALRSRYRRVLGLEAPGEPDRILIAYAAPDRPWADWIQGKLERRGAHVRSFTDDDEWLSSDDPPGLVVVSCTHMDTSAVRVDVDRTAMASAAAGRPLTIVRVDIDSRDLVEANRTTIVVSPGAENAALSQLVEHFDLIDLPGLDPDPDRPPGDYPEIFGVPPRHPNFIGRDDEIEQLRDKLTAESSGPATVVLSGTPGIGKSELALEYAYRFGNDYDLVWWVPSGDEQSLLLSLARLANRLEIPGSHGYGNTSALTRLADDRGHRRFLLIYDNADEPAGLEARLPVGHRGHVIVTTRQASDTPFELTAMGPEDSVSMLRVAVDGLSEDDARSAAAAADHLPIALELAGAWLGETAKALRRGGATVTGAASAAVHELLAGLEANGQTEPDAVDPSPREPVARVVSVVTTSMNTAGPRKVALLVARMCSFLSPDWVGLDLVRSVAFCDRLKSLSGLDTEGLKLDAFELDHALRIGARYGLFRLTWGDQRALRVHRIVQEALRQSVTPREAAKWQRETLAALAAYAPSEVEDQAPYYTARFTELLRHVYPSGAIESRDDAVRRWLVNQARFLYVSADIGVHRAAVAPTQKLLDDWKVQFGSDDRLVLRLSGWLANLHRALGEPYEAFRLVTEAIAHQRRVLGFEHPQVLLSARGRAADLRSLGNFREALEEDRTTWAGLCESLGDDHPQTRATAHNLASSLFLAGEIPAALQTARSNYRRRQRLLDERDPMIWSSLVQIGIYQRELGDYDGATASLRQASQRLRDAQQPSSLELTIRRHLAITLRCQGQPAVAKERIGTVLTELREQLGPDHPNTLACMLSLAAACRAAGADADLAVELAQTAFAGLRTKVKLVPEHPFVALCKLGLGMARRAAGQSGSKDTGEALSSLRKQLGDVHPWTIAAAVDHANVTSIELLTQTHQHCLEYLGAKHPYTIAAEHNLELARLPSTEHVGMTWREIDVDIPET